MLFFVVIEVKTDVKKFMFIMEKLLDQDLELETDGNLDINEDAEIPPEALMPRALISALNSEVAKMKSNKMLNEVGECYTFNQRYFYQKKEM